MMDRELEKKVRLLSHSPAYQALREHWDSYDAEDRRAHFHNLARPEAEEFFLHLGAADQYELLIPLSWPERRSWFRLLAPDDCADLIQDFPESDRARAIALLDDATAKEVIALLAYAEDAAGGLMSPRFVRLRPDTTVDVAIRYLRVQAKTPIESVHYGYVLEGDQTLVGVLSFRELLLAPPERRVDEIMHTELVTVPEHLDQEDVSRKFAQSGLSALPVVDSGNRMKGIITVDDVVEVVEEEATEDIQKLGGLEALDSPYLKTGFFEMVRKRAGWLTILFVGEMFTASAMGHYAGEIERAVVLALFIPLIISSGGNSGSQATTLIIRAIALRELRLRDWWRVLVRETASGLTLGLILGCIGIVRVVLWPGKETLYGEHYMQVALVVGISLVGVVLWGAMAGSMLPFVLRRMGLDPASASAPFVATIVDVTGLVIYFSVASSILGGTLL